MPENLTIDSIDLEQSSPYKNLLPGIKDYYISIKESGRS